MGGFRSCGKLQIEIFPFHTMVNFFTLRELIVENLYFGVSSSLKVDSFSMKSGDDFMLFSFV